MHTWRKEFLKQREKKTINLEKKNTWILSGKVKQGIFEKMVDSTEKKKTAKKKKNRKEEQRPPVGE